jgi:hypothetical protein
MPGGYSLKEAPGGHGAGPTPDPIPNSEVNPDHSDEPLRVNWLETFDTNRLWESPP